MEQVALLCDAEEAPEELITNIPLEKSVFVLYVLYSDLEFYFLSNRTTDSTFFH